MTKAACIVKRCSATFFFLIAFQPTKRSTALVPLRVALTAGRISPTDKINLPAR